MKRKCACMNRNEKTYLLDISSSMDSILDDYLSDLDNLEQDKFLWD